MNGAPAAVLSPAGPVAQALAELSWLLIVGATVILVMLTALSWWAVWGRRERSGTTERQLVQRWIIAGGLLFPTVVLAGLLVHTVHTARALDPAGSPGEAVIGVTGRLWWWEVHYDDPSSGARFALANEIRVPVGRTVTLGLNSADVIHSFWVPALAGKVDMVPGRVHQLRVSASRPGVFRGQCAEFCGDQHARMAIHVVALEPADYDRWVAAQMRPAALPTGAQAERGYEVYRQQRCDACHAVRGLLPGTGFGPDLTHVGSRLHIGAGSLPTNAASFERWIAHNQQVKPGVRMPSYGHLDPASLTALSAFLEQLR